MNLLQKYTFRIIKTTFKSFFSGNLSFFNDFFSLLLRWCEWGGGKEGRQLSPRDRNGKAPERAGVSSCSGTSSL